MDFDKYKNTKTYPRKEDFTTTFYYKMGKLVATAIQNPGFAISQDQVRGCTVEKYLDDDAYKAAKQEWIEHNRRLDELFKKDLFEDLGISDNPKREKLYSIAYEKGHSGGNSEIYSEELDLVDLIL